jgi:dipeptidyl aminopeptidase/acylaminoacyl peptidase
MQILILVPFQIVLSVAPVHVPAISHSAGNSGTALVAALNQAATIPPVRDPGFATDGRLAVSFEGDLWLRDAGGRRWTRLTSGPGWDRQPAWSPDGQTIVFVSDREGGSHLFRVALRGGVIERLTNDALPDAEPTVTRDGSVAFVRGRGPAARLWVRSPEARSSA